MRQPVRASVLVLLIGLIAATAVGCGGGGGGTQAESGEESPAAGEMTQECVDGLRAFNDYMAASFEALDATGTVAQEWGDVYEAVVEGGLTEAEAGEVITSYNRSLKKAQRARAKAEDLLAELPNLSTACDAATIPPACAAAVEQAKKVLALDLAAVKRALKLLGNVAKAETAAEAGDREAVIAVGESAAPLVKRFNNAMAKLDSAWERYQGALEGCTSSY